MNFCKYLYSSRSVYIGSSNVFASLISKISWSISWLLSVPEALVRSLLSISVFIGVAFRRSFQLRYAESLPVEPKILSSHFNKMSSAASGITETSKKWTKLIQNVLLSCGLCRVIVKRDFERWLLTI